MITPWPAVLTLAGSDPSGGAGLQADLKVFHQHRCFGLAVATCITVQDAREVQQVLPLPGSLVTAQVEAATRAIPPRAAKVGAMGSSDAAEAIARWIGDAGIPIVVDPVRAATAGHPLIDEEGWLCLRERILPHATLVTPNLREASLILGIEAEPEAMARAIADLGPRSVLVTGVGTSRDILFANEEIHAFDGAPLPGPPPHGTGCALTAAITARLARGEGIRDAVAGAKGYVTDAIGQARSGLLGFHAAVPGGILEMDADGGPK